MKHLLKAVEGEQVRNATPWDLTFYDDENGNIKTITKFEYSEDRE